MPSMPATLAGRPTGITILAVLAAIGGVLSILGGLTLTFIGGVVGALGAGVGSGSGAVLGGLVFFYGIFVLALGVVSIVVAYGLWNLRPWAYQVALILAIAEVALAVLGWLLFGQGIVGAIITAAIYGAVIYYLRTPDIRSRFGQA